MDLRRDDNPGSYPMGLDSVMTTARLPLPEEADAVVVGAGACGLATGYQLAKAGADRVVILDQYEPGSQVSPKAAGLFKLIQSSESLTRVAQLSIEIVQGFAAETG